MESGFASLCLLSFNRPKFLQECVESIKENAGYPYELIIHDDGSTDPQVKVLLDHWIETGQVSTVISNPPGHNQGVGTAIKRMFNMAQGDFMVKLDQDLLFNSGFLKEANSLLETNKFQRDNHTQGLGRPVDPEIAVLGLLHYHHDPVDTDKCRLQDYGYMETHTHILGSAFAVTRDVWDEYGYRFKEHSDAFSEDYEFMLEMTQDDHFCCALPKKDLCTNRGMGIGPSTVVVAENTVQVINHQPVLFNE